MDKVLELRMIKNTDSTQASDLLEQSILLKKLTSEFKKKLFMRFGALLFYLKFPILVNFWIHSRFFVYRTKPFYRIWILFHRK